MTNRVIEFMSEEEVRANYAALQEEVAFLRRLAAVGERAMRGEWWKHNPQRDVYICLVCLHCNGHTNDCAVLAAQETS